MLCVLLAINTRKHIWGNHFCGFVLCILFPKLHVIHQPGRKCGVLIAGTLTAPGPPRPPPRPGPTPTPPRPQPGPRPGPPRPHTWTGLAAFLGTHGHRRLLSRLLLFPLPSDWAQRRRVCERRQGCLKQNTRHREGSVTNKKPRTRLCVYFTICGKEWNSFHLTLHLRGSESVHTLSTLIHTTIARGERWPSTS